MACLAAGVVEQAAIFAGSCPALVSASFRVASEVGGSKSCLRFKQRIGEFEEGIVAAELGDTIAVCRGLERLGVNLAEWEILIDEVSTRIVSQQLGDDGLCVLAVGALKIGELHKFHCFGRSALGWPGGVGLQYIAIGLEWLGTKG